MKRLTHSEDGESVNLLGFTGSLILSADDADALAAKLISAANRARAVAFPAGWNVVQRQVMVSSGVVEAIVAAEKP